MNGVLTEHCGNRGLIRPQQHKSMRLSSTQALKKGEIVINGFLFKDVTHVQITGQGSMDFVKLLRNGETLATVDVRIVKGTVFTHSLTDKKVLETMLKVCPNLEKVHNS